MSEYQPTSIVLAKVKGYPAWPAMVLDESLLPEHISNKTKIENQSSNINFISHSTISIEKKPSIIVPVRFFSDDTYIWINTNDLKPLTKQMIQDYFSTSSKRKIDNLLQTAYELANDPPEMGLFIEYGSKGAPPTPPPMEEEDETKPKSPVKKKVKKQ